MIAAVLWHFVIAPYLVITAILFAAPAIGVAALGSSNHWNGAAWLVVVGLRSGLCLAVVRSLGSKVAVAQVHPTCRRETNDGRRLDDPRRTPAIPFRGARRYLSEYGQLSRQASDDYLAQTGHRSREEH